MFTKQHGSLTFVILDEVKREDVVAPVVEVVVDVKSDCIPDDGARTDCMIRVTRVGTAPTPCFNG